MADLPKLGIVTLLNSMLDSRDGDKISPIAEPITLDDLTRKGIIEACSQSQGQPCVCGALVKCTAAKDELETVHITKKENGRAVKVANVEQLNERDITRERPFSGCRFSEDGKCSTEEEYIEGKAWQGVDKSVKNDPNMKFKGRLLTEGRNLLPHSWGLNVNESYMICTHGYGLIYFENAGQSYVNTFLEEAECLVVPEVDLDGELGVDQNREIDDLKAEIYRRVKGDGGIEAVQVYLDGYYTEDLKEYLAAIGMRESTGNYQAQSGSHIGLYQLGIDAFIDIEWLKPESGTYEGNWTETASWFGVDSVQSFKDNETAQHVAMALYLRVEYMNLCNNGTINLVGNPIVDKRTEGGNETTEITVTLSGLLAASHLVGIGTVKDAYESNNWSEAMDGNGTYATEYMEEFGGCDDVKLLIGYVKNAEEVGIE